MGAFFRSGAFKVILQSRPLGPASALLASSAARRSTTATCGPIGGPEVHIHPNFRPCLFDFRWQSTVPEPVRSLGLVSLTFGFKELLQRWIFGCLFSVLVRSRLYFALPIPGRGGVRWDGCARDRPPNGMGDPPTPTHKHITPCTERKLIPFVKRRTYTGELLLRGRLEV